MQVYHVVTDRPMKCGQHIIFDENHHSGVYERVQEKMEKVHESDNELLTGVSNSLILEAVSHFNTTRSRLREGDERYFYKWDEVDAVLSQLKDPDSVSIQAEKDFDGSVFCYIMNFAVLKKETRVR